MLALATSAYQLRLTEFATHHLTDEYVSWLNDPVAMQFSEQRHIQHTISSCLDYLHDMEEKGNRLLAIEVLGKHKWIHVGNIAIIPDLPNKVAELSILIGQSSARGKGLGALAWSLAAIRAVEEFQVESIFAGTMAENFPMRRVFSKTGMKEVGQIPARFIREGERTALVVASGIADGFEDYLLTLPKIESRPRLNRVALDQAKAEDTGAR